MNYQRTLGLVLVLTTAYCLGYASQQFFYPVIISCIALIGYIDKFHISLTPARRSILLLAITLVFAIQYRYINPSGGAPGFIHETRWYPAARYFLVLFAAQFFFYRKNTLPPYFPMIGLVNIIFIGLALNQSAIRQYEISVIVFLLLALMYSATCRSYEKRPTTSMTTRLIVGLFILSGAVVLGWRSGSYWIHHSQSIESFIQSMDPTTYLFRLMPGPRGAVGFSRETELGSVSELSQAGGNKVALHVFTGFQPGYMRGNAFERYSTGQWLTETDPNNYTPSPHLPPDLRLQPEANTFVIYRTRTRQWQILDIWPDPKIETGGMFSLLGTSVVEAPVDILKCDVNRIFDSDELIGGLNYRIAVPLEPEFRSPGRHTDFSYLEVPSTFRNSGFFRDLSRHIFRGCRSTQEKIEAVTAYFHNNYSYHLGVDVPGRVDPLLYFLREKPDGHCEYFASGAAILLRSAGVPTRYVTGFFVGEQNSYLDCWLARNRDAHAWVEAWDEHSKEWVIVEATPAAGVPQPETASTWSYFLDSLWFRLLELRVQLYQNGIKGGLAWLSNRLMDFINIIFSTISGWIFLFSLAALIWVITFVRWSRRRHLNRLEPDIHKLRRLLTQMDRRLRRLGFVREPCETLHQFSDRLSNNGGARQDLSRAAQWYGRYARLRYKREDLVAELPILQEHLDNTLKSLPRR